MYKNIFSKLKNFIKKKNFQIKNKKINYQNILY